MQTLVGIAVERGSKDLAKRVADMLRDVLFDASEMPQLRIQALNSLTRPWLDLDDVRRLTRVQDAGSRAQADSMRALMKDFLFEYF
jgi:hypothetical protein